MKLQHLFTEHVERDTISYSFNLWYANDIKYAFLHVAYNVRGYYDVGHVHVVNFPAGKPIDAIRSAIAKIDTFASVRVSDALKQLIDERLQYKSSLSCPKADYDECTVRVEQAIKDYLVASFTEKSHVSYEYNTGVIE